ncbi:alpha/beta hydrolase [Crenobacter cavernae]|uniref:Alpha/beta hydrolase n=1 Tax=Crenobacter cavernae TaxID=2290923 RepID=A0ABY0FEM3_9NEIS|nr:alpha/beta fold hydrolase [Crenobacter cavernae]RXZ43437.1 alpha/beta hydrolase [Crenobacter cavernae]
MPSNTPRRGLDFDALLPALARRAFLPPLESYVARDGSALGYRRYGRDAGVDLILVHGSGSHSAYLAPLAEALVAARSANVYTPDLRGHGASPARRGDIDYIDQLEDDLADLIAHIASRDGAGRKLVVAGHSSGGGLALRFAGGRHGRLADATLLLAPYLGHAAPTVRRHSGGWARPNLARIIPIALLNGLGIRRFNGATVIGFDMPEAYRDGTETLAYSYRLMTGYAPRDYDSDLAAISQPLLVLVGAEDEAFLAGAFTPTVTAAAPHASVRVVAGTGHLGLVSSPATGDTAAAWIRGL